jgi:superoxide reductase
MKFGDILKSKEAEGKEKHIPAIEVGKGRGEMGADIVHVVVGKETPHPNTVEHHIAWIQVFGMKKDGQIIDLGRSTFAPVYTNPNIRFQVPVAEFKAFCALAYCNIHGLWGNYIET